MIKLPYNLTDLLFRLLFSLIFIGLGMEHLFADQIIQSMMPDWFYMKRPLSVVAGVIVLLGGFSILIGYHTRHGAVILGAFLITVTLTIHGPALFSYPTELPSDWHWLWEVYQRSNFVKNLCLLGGCAHFINHQPGKYSLDAYLVARRVATQDPSENR